MKVYTLIILLFCCITISIQAKANQLAANGHSDYKIILARGASHWDSLAAKELQHYLKEICGAKIPVENKTNFSSFPEIILSTSDGTDTIDRSAIITDDGFIIRTIGDKIYFTAKTGKGVLNAVYTFLEKYLNCRMYSSTVQIIPRQDSIVLPEINLLENPAFSYRSMHYILAENEKYCRWHKLVGPQEKKNTWGLFVHTFQELLPQEKYFKKHPEYFALRNDSLRVPEQPCLSNPAVFKIVVDELAKRMQKNPDAKIWSVSQNDNYFYCQCPLCARQDSLAGSPAGSVINFVNRVARKFRDKTISTLAYQYSRKPPVNIKPGKNVNIMLCTIECFRTHPLETDTSEGAFMQDLKGWSKLTDNIFIWDYVVQFTNYVSPFPNFQVLQPNIQTFSKYGAKMIFEQGAGGCDGAEFNELRSYLIAKLLWDPDLNVDSVMTDFLDGYYGPAGKYLKDYITLMKDKLLQSGANLWIYDSPVNSMKDYLAPVFLSEYNDLFDQAENAVASLPDYLERVKIARLPLVYAMLEQAKVIGIGANGTIIKSTAGSYKTNPKITSLLDTFLSGCKLAGNVFVDERRLPATTYVSRYKTMLGKTMVNPLGLFKPVKYLTQPSDKYPANGDSTLTDGLRGDEDHHFNWLGFEGNDMEVILDLEKKTVVKNVHLDFLQIVFSYIFLPKKVNISVSNDGQNFTEIAAIKSNEPLDRPGAFIKTFTADFGPIETRYIKVKAESIKTCPRWHRGYPDKAWIFTDEIVVE